MSVEPPDFIVRTGRRVLTGAGQPGRDARKRAASSRDERQGRVAAALLAGAGQPNAPQLDQVNGCAGMLSDDVFDTASEASRRLKRVERQRPRGNSSPGVAVEHDRRTDVTAATITRVRAAGDDHQVVTVEGGRGSYRRRPCSDCPWRVDAVGKFPPEAFRHSANTAYDMSTHAFACHQSGSAKPAACAGFLLRGAEHNLGVRLKRMNGSIGDDVTDGGHALHASYRAMAEANGVDPDDDALRLCRD